MPKLTMFFKDGEYGWSETHYYATVNAPLETVLLQGKVLATVRSTLLGNQPRLTYLRVSYDDVWRDSLIDSRSSDVMVNTDGPDAEIPYSVILVRGNSGTLYRKSIYVSGIADSAIVDPAGPKLTADYLKAFKKYFTALTDFWGFRVIIRDTVTNPYRDVTAITGPAPMTFTVPAHGLATNDSIRYQGYKDQAKASCNGIWTIDKVDADNFKLRGFTQFLLPLKFGRIQKRTIGVVPYTELIIVGETHRKRGRPFDSPRGRAKKRA